MAFRAGERITADRLNLEIGPAEPWQNAVLENGWVPFGGGFGTPGFRLHAGNVELRGTMSGGATADGTRLFILPVNYRPTWNQQIMIRSESTINTFLQIDVAGHVGLYSGNPTNALTMDGVFFPRS